MTTPPLSKEREAEIRAVSHFPSASLGGKAIVDLLAELDRVRAELAAALSERDSARAECVELRDALEFIRLAIAAARSASANQGGLP